jgi:hypothetical protein
VQVGDLVRNKGYMNNDLMGTGLVYAIERINPGVRRYKVYWAYAEIGRAKNNKYTLERLRDIEVISENR